MDHGSLQDMVYRANRELAATGPVSLPFGNASGADHGELVALAPELRGRDVERRHGPTADHGRVSPRSKPGWAGPGQPEAGQGERA